MNVRVCSQVTVNGTETWQYDIRKNKNEPREMAGSLWLGGLPRVARKGRLELAMHQIPKSISAPFGPLHFNVDLEKG